VITGVVIDKASLDGLAGQETDEVAAWCQFLDLLTY
jgi:hypothetical protein